MNINWLKQILVWLQGLFASMNRQDLMEDVTFLSAGTAALTVAPFDITTPETWLGIAVAGKSMVSLLANLKWIKVGWIQAIGKWVATINQNDVLEDLAMLSASVKALLMIPFDPRNSVWYLAAGACFKAAYGLAQAVGLISDKTTLPASAVNHDIKQAS